IERVSTRLALAEARVVRDPLDVTGRFDLTIGREGEAPIELDGALALDDGSAIRIEGTSSTSGVVDVRADLESFDLAIARPFVSDPALRLEGRATGDARVVGDLAAPEFLSLDLGVEDGVVVSGEASLEGPYLASLKMKEPLSRPRGRLELDLSATSLRYGETFAKPAGVRAEATARFVPEETGEVVFEANLALRDLDEILIQGAVGDSTTVAVTTTDIDLEGWEEILPVLAPWAPRGRVALDGLAVELIDGAPSQFGGRLAMRGIALTIPDAGRVQLRGSIVGEETRIRTQGLKAKLGPAVIAIQGAIEDPLGEGRFDLAIRTAGDVEANDVLSNLTTARNTVYGPLRFTGDVTGRLDDPNGIAPTLAGDVRFSVGERTGGRLRGVSILRTVLDQIPLAGGAALLSRPFRGGRSVDDFFAERFEIIEGVFEIGDGRVEAETLRLAYPGYEARLTGPMRLADLSIDMKGEVLLKSDLVSTLGGLAGANVPDREPIRIELAKVTNTLSEPEVEMTAETLAAVPKLLFQGIGLDTITKGIGRGVGDALDRVLGGN
ncbi:MAG: AsmA-like C-terminal region-containing protein, partial [Myxococcota bacterium]